MLQMYILIEIKPDPEFNFLKVVLWYSTLYYVVQLNANCLISGLVHDEADHLLSALDDFQFTGKETDDMAYKESLLFMSMSRDLKIGPTIGGFMPLKRTTLLSVSDSIINDPMVVSSIVILGLWFHTNISGNLVPNRSHWRGKCQ